LKKINCITFSDSELVEKSIQDTAYFKCLYERYEKKLLIYIRRISNVTEEEALDILQESFIKIWKNLNDFDPDLSFNSWVYRIVHHQTISEWRKSISYGKNKTVDFEKSLQYISFEVDENQPVEQEQKVMEILSLLSENYKNVLILKYFESKNYEEISDILKIPEGTVATYLNRAKKKFSELAAKKNISFFI
jgi:RNA polymerase sigma-70 factor (ECF subfamily)